MACGGANDAGPSASTPPPALPPSPPPFSSAAESEEASPAMSPGSEEEEWMEWQQQQLQLASTPAAPDACVTPMLTRQELRDLGMSQDEDGRLSVQRTGRSSSKGKQAAAAAAAAAGMKSDPRTILQALAALIRALNKPVATAPSTSRPPSIKPFSPTAGQHRAPTSGSSSTAAASPSSLARRQHQQQQQQHDRDKVAVPIPILLESMRMLLALPCCDARLSAAVLRATRHACGAAKGVQAIKGVVETFDHLRLDVFVIRSLEQPSHLPSPSPYEDNDDSHHTTNCRDRRRTGSSSIASGIRRRRGSSGVGGGTEATMRVLERLEALKLLRCFLLLYKEEEGGQEDRALCLPASAAASSSSTATFLMSLVAVCAHAGGEQGGGGPVEDGDFRKLCLETLREAAVAHPSLLAACDGFRPLVTTVLDPALSPELGEPILYTLLHLADDPTTRRFRFRPFLELQAVLGPFTNADSAVVPSSQPEGEALLEASRRALLLLLRTWTGLSLLAGNERKGLKALLHGVLGDGSVSPRVRLALFEVLESLLWPLLASFFAAAEQQPADSPHNVLNSFLAFLLPVLLHCGLLESLTAFAIGPHTDPSHGRAGTLLVDIVRTLPLTLPEPQWLSLVSMPALVRICEAAQQAGATAVGTAAVDAQLLANRGADLMRRLCRAGLPAAAPMGQRRREDGGGGGVGALGVESLAGVYPGLSDPYARHHHGGFVPLLALLHDSDSLDLTLLPYLDTGTSRRALQDLTAQSRVLLGKDPRAWDWTAILSLAEDTFRDPARVAEAAQRQAVGNGRVSLLKRLCDPYRLAAGDRGFFPDLPWSPQHLRLLPVALALHRSLLLSPEGRHFLATEPRARGPLQDFAALLHQALQQQQQPANPKSSSNGSPLMSTTQRLLGAASPTALLFSSSLSSSSPVPFPTSTQAAAAAAVATTTPSSSSSPVLSDARWHCTLLREYFRLLGLFSHDHHGLSLLRHSGLLPLLPRLGHRPATLPLARLLLVHLSYTGPCPLGRDLLFSWLINTTTTSTALRSFALNVLKALLHDPRVPRVEEWGIEALLAVAHASGGGEEEKELVAAAVAVLEEAAALSLAFQRSIALKLPHHASSSSTTTSCSDAHALRKQQQYYERMRGLFLRLLGCDAGLTVLEREGWLARIREEWALTNDAVSGYAHAVERRLMQASFAMADGQTDKSFTPLPLLSPAPASQRPKPTPPPIVLRCQELAALCPGSGPAQDLRALLALPWRIQVQAFPDDDTSETDEGPTPAPTALLLELDTTADIASSLRPFPRWAEDWDEVYGPTAFRVRGRLLDPITGKPTPILVHKAHALRACLRLGHCFLDCHGQLSTPPPPSPPQPPIMTDGGSSSSPFLAADAPSSRPGLRKGSSSLSFFLSTIRFRDPSSSSSTKAAAAARHHSSIYGGGEGAGASSFGSEDCGPPEPPLTPMPSGLVDDLEQHLADWSVCRPIHRRRSQLAQQQPQHQRAKAFHAVAGDYPALWTFSQAPTTTRRATTPAPPSSPSPAVTMDDRRSSPVRRLSSPQQLSPLSLPITKRLPPTPVATGGARSPASSASQRQQQQQEQAETLMAVEFVVVLQYEEGRYTAPLPLHPYGELAKTRAGCRYLRSSGLLDDLAAALQNNQPTETSFPQQHALMWAVAHACATDGGTKTLLHSCPQAVAWLVRVTETHPRPSTRGLAFSALQLVAQGSEAGRTALRACGWEVGGTGPRHTAVPADVRRVLQLIPSSSSSCLREEEEGKEPAESETASPGSGGSGVHVPFAAASLPGSLPSEQKEQGSSQPQQQQQQQSRCLPFSTPSCYSPSPSPNAASVPGSGPVRGLSRSASALLEGRGRAGSGGGGSGGGSSGRIALGPLPVIATNKEEEAAVVSPSPPAEAAATAAATARTAAGEGGSVVEEEVMALVVKLSNYVTRKEAQLQLMRLRRKPRYRRKFTSLRFYLRVHEFMARYAFPLPVRRFVAALFEEVDLSGASWAGLKEHHHQQHPRVETGMGGVK